MGKETKIGLGVIAVLLAIFVFVLFKKFWGAAEETVAAAETSTKPAAAAQTKGQPSVASSKSKSPAPANRSPASAWSSDRDTGRSGANPPKSAQPAAHENPFRAVSGASSRSAAEGPGLQQPGNFGGQSQTSVSVTDEKPKPASQPHALPAFAAPSASAFASQPSGGSPTYSPFHQPAGAAVSSSATVGDLGAGSAAASDNAPHSASTSLAANNAYDPLGATQAAPAETHANSSRRAPALLGQASTVNDATIEPVAAEGYTTPAPPAYGRPAAPRSTPGGQAQHGVYGASQGMQHSGSPAPLPVRNGPTDFSQADAYNVAGGGTSGRTPIQHSAPQTYDQSRPREPFDRLPQGQSPHPSVGRQEPTHQLGPDRRYVVQPNDNYWSISQKVFGTGAYFKAILQHQRDRGRAIDEHLQPGEVLAVPPAELLAKNYPHLCPRQPIPSVAASQMMQVSAPRQGLGGRGMYYVVEEGDTLFDIARYELGKAARWVEIYELNRDQIGEDFDNLKPGTQLVLPNQGAPDSVTRAPAGMLRR